MIALQPYKLQSDQHLIKLGGKWLKAECGIDHNTHIYKKLTFLAMNLLEKVETRTGTKTFIKQRNELLEEYEL